MIALDIAKKCGIAFVSGDTIKVLVCTGDAQKQGLLILGILESVEVKRVFAEDLPRMRNMNTTKSLLRRQGNLECFLLLKSVIIEYIRVATARKSFGKSDKAGVQSLMSKYAGFELTTDEADAIVVLLYGGKLKISDYKIERIKLSDIEAPKIEPLKRRLNAMLARRTQNASDN